MRGGDTKIAILCNKNSSLVFFPVFHGRNGRLISQEFRAEFGGFRLGMSAVHLPHQREGNPEAGAAQMAKSENPDSRDSQGIRKVRCPSRGFQISKVGGRSLRPELLEGPGCLPQLGCTVINGDGGGARSPTGEKGCRYRAERTALNPNIRPNTVPVTCTPHADARWACIIPHIGSNRLGTADRATASFQGKVVYSYASKRLPVRNPRTKTVYKVTTTTTKTPSTSTINFLSTFTPITLTSITPSSLRPKKGGYNERVLLFEIKKALRYNIKPIYLEFLFCYLGNPLRGSI
ncbi:hypothetical protein V8F20_007410 [Naviculisporaceae sp. PSN 640]